MTPRWTLRTRLASRHSAAWSSSLNPCGLVRTVGASLLLAILVTAPTTSMGEVAVSGSGPRPSLALFGWDDPNPHPSWAALRLTIDPTLLLNPHGDDTGDGPPSAAIGHDGNPEVVWDRWDGHDHEIMYSRWDGVRWTEPRPLTDNDDEDVSPALTIDVDGTRHLVWRREGRPGTVRYTSLTSTGQPSTEEAVGVEGDRYCRPTVAIHASSPRVARSDVESHGWRTIVVSRREHEAWHDDVVGLTCFGGTDAELGIDVQVHDDGRRLWVDWIDGVGILAFAVWSEENQGWERAQPMPYTWDDSLGVSEWTGRELARVSIRARLASN